MNYLWNYCQAGSLLALRREKKLLSAYDLHTLTAGTSKDLRLSADTMQHVCTAYVTRRRPFQKRRLTWRSKQRALGWIPCKAASSRLEGGTVTYCAHRFRLGRSRPVLGTITTGSFCQEARGRWDVNGPCDVPEIAGPPAPDEIGIDLGLKAQIAWTQLPAPLARAHLPRHDAEPRAMAQRAQKTRRVQALHATSDVRRCKGILGLQAGKDVK